MTDKDLQWLMEALKEGHQEETAFLKEPVGGLQAIDNRRINRIELIYEDKLDGQTSEALWFRKHEQYKQELAEVEARLAQHTKGNLDCVESGVQLLELAKNAYPLYISQSALEQRRMLNFLFQNTSLKDGNLSVDWKNRSTG